MSFKAIRPQAPGTPAPANNPTPTPRPTAVPNPTPSEPNHGGSTTSSLNFPSPAQFPVMSAFCRDLSDELGKVLGIVTGVIDYGAHSGSGDIALETSSSVTMATDYALTLSRNLTFIQGLLSGEKLSPQKFDVAQILMDTYMLNQKYLTHRQTIPSLVVDKSCMAEVDPNAVHHVVCTLLIRAGKNVNPGGAVTVTLNQHPNDLEIVFAETNNPNPFNANDNDVAVCKMLLEAHGGKFDATSANGETKISMVFPAPNGVETSKNSANKRRHRRARARFAVDFHFSSDMKEMQTFTANVSVNGVMIAYPPDKFKTKPQVGAEIGLKIHCSRDRVLDIPKARIAAVLNTSVGVEFGEIDDKTRRILAGIVKSRPY